MGRSILKAEVLSDGLLVVFSGGTQCYFSAKFLMSQVGVGSNQVFLNYDPSEVVPVEMPVANLPMNLLAS